MKPNFDPNANPFESIIASLKAQPKGGQPAGQPTGSGMAAQQAMMQGMKGPKQPPSQLDYGSVGGTTPALTSALQAMQKFLAESQDPTEIAIGRSIITLLTKLINEDQQKQVSQLPSQGAEQTPPQG